MVQNQIIVCPICGKKTWLRIQVGGYLNEYPIRVNCINCHTLMKGSFVMNSNKKTIGLTMINSEIEECNITVLEGDDPYCVNNADYVAEISGELPCNYPEVYHGGFRISPFMNTIKRIDDLKNYYDRLNSFNDSMLEWLTHKSVAFQLFDDGSIDYVAVALNNQIGKYKYECDHYIKSLHCLQEVVYEEAFYLYTDPDIWSLISSVMVKLSELNSEQVSSFVEENGGIEELLLSYRKCIEVFSRFMEIYPSILPAEVYSKYKEKDDATCLSTCSFSDIKTFYQDTYETLLSLMHYPVCADNIILRGEYSAFSNDYLNVRGFDNTLHSYKELNNGIRFNKINEEEPYQKMIALQANRFLRNGIGHNNVKYNSVNQTIIAYDLKNPSVEKASMTLMDMALECIALVKSSISLSEMILFMLRSEFRKEGIRTILHPRFYEGIKPNDKCPCGSGLKYKKCCRQQVEVVLRQN